jgi:hypothetical protein
VSRYNFPGYPAFIEAAAIDLGLSANTYCARRDDAIALIASLCAQAADGESKCVEGILVEAERYVQQLRLGLRAAELMIANVRIGRTPPVKPVSVAKRNFERRGGRHA